jgi:hypothetical protein
VLEHAGQEDVVAGVRGGLDEVLGERELDAGDVREVLDGRADG